MEIREPLASRFMILDKNDGGRRREIPKVDGYAIDNMRSKGRDIHPPDPSDRGVAISVAAMQSLPLKPPDLLPATFKPFTEEDAATVVRHAGEEERNNASQQTSKQLKDTHLMKSQFVSMKDFGLTLEKLTVEDAHNATKAAAVIYVFPVVKALEIIRTEAMSYLLVEPFCSKKVSTQSMHYATGNTTGFELCITMITNGWEGVRAIMHSALNSFQL
ncbi:hypothetical protein PIB30_071074 [Stylosanthes scabra]|uniref:Uncharacterized protein n=1 Tax=Stylosanthes scabra TaxID=79078 RepID=A0ABU6UR41_9FABA|nr:hypothetical protein [Stylosanthes scabra]